MLMPRIFDDDFFDDWMRWPVSRSLADTEKQLYGKHAPHVAPPSSQDEALSRYSVSGEVPR